ncbi:hypothetical protein PV327_005435 [Microctonus hyperodae]|uniref:Choline transporter-like protein n=1 Tax=Microctonus hyperodae TaxID=165561 RepID=A0AA39G1C4_MICHY|nr:hypothetical protein PV327_005435 [Microctonus hyperodae]
MTMNNDESVVLEPTCRGPSKNRNCTDVPCLIIFALFILCWFGVGYYALFVGDINAFLVPTDSKGRKCGVDADVIDKPFLVFFDITKCINYRCNTPQVCRSQCPQSNWYFNPNPQSINETYDAMLCSDGITVRDKNIKALKQLIISKACAKWYLKSTPVLKRCIPQLFEASFRTGLGNDAVNITNGELVKPVKVVKFLTSIHSIVNEAILTMDSVIMFIFGGMLVCLLYIMLLRWIALPCIWIAIIFIVVLLSCFSYLCYNYYINNNWIGWIILSSILGGFALIIAIMAVCVRKKIYLACQLITETSKATIHILSIVFFPVLPWLISLSVIIYSIVIALYLMSIEDQEFLVKEELSNGNCQCSMEVNYTIGDSCKPELFYKYCHEDSGSCFSMSCLLNDTTTPKYKYYLYAAHLVGFIWLYLFIIDFKKIVIASTYATWYWTLCKTNIPYFITIESLCRVIRYHLGTVAFGSVIITICRLFRIFIKYLHHASKKESTNFASLFVKSCLFYCSKCFIFIVEKLLKFSTISAYIMCAINGKGLCASAVDALSLIIRDIIRVAVLNRVVYLLLKLGKILITSLMILLAYWYFNSNGNSETREYWYVPIILIGIGTYLAATIFFSVCTIGVSTIFLCVLQDCEYHDGSNEKPYYMNQNIGKLLHVS